MFTESPRVTATMRRMLEVIYLRSTQPWIHVNTVVFANDTLGLDEEGRPTRIDHDVVVAVIAPTSDGRALLVLRSPTNPGAGSVGDR